MKFAKQHIHFPLQFITRCASIYFIPGYIIIKTKRFLIALKLRYLIRINDYDNTSKHFPPYS